jgi:predicted phage replisome organizer
MADIKKYYYLKLKDNFFNTQQVMLLERMPKGIYYSNLLIKLYLIALKQDGALKLNDDIFYDEKMIASLTNLNISIVRNGLKVLASLGFIERFGDGAIYMTDIQSFVGKSNSEAERKKLYRGKIEEEKILLGQISQNCPSRNGTSGGIFSEKRPPENRDNSSKLIANSLDIKAIKNKEIETKYNIASLSVGLLKDFEDRTGTIGGLNLAALKKTVELHGADNVKRAIDKALEKNKPTMTYINGILKNWAAEGYPKEGEKGGNGSSGKNNGAGSNEFAGFKPKDPRNLSDEERAALETELL